MPMVQELTITLFSNEALELEPIRQPYVCFNGHVIAFENVRQEFQREQNLYSLRGNIYPGSYCHSLTLLGTVEGMKPWELEQITVEAVIDDPTPMNFHWGKVTLDDKVHVNLWDNNQSTEHLKF